MIPTPIRQVLSTFQKHGVQALLMGGQACVLYGAAQVSKDVDFILLSIPDLVQTKKTQRSKDWPVIELLVAIHYRENQSNPRPDWVRFWLQEARSVELLQELVRRFVETSNAVCPIRPLLAHASAGDVETLRAALDAEVRAEQAKDRAYWEPLRRELEVFRREELHRGPTGRD